MTWRFFPARILRTMTKASPPVEHIVVLSTCPNEVSARRIAEALVGTGLAACVNIVPSVTSVYRWQGRLESATEYLLVIKTRAERYAALEAAIRSQHPYELPEVVAVPMVAASAPYLAWIDSLTCASSSSC